MMHRIFLIVSLAIVQSIHPAPLASLWKQLQAGNDITRDQKLALFIKDCAKISKTFSLPAHAKNQSTVRIATYNVHFWTNPYRDQNYRAIMQVLSQINADIIALQEVLLTNPKEIKSRFMKMGYRYQHFLKTHDFRNHPFGNMILSKYPFISVIAKPYTIDKNVGEKRNYIHAVINVNGTRLSVYATHLDAYDDTEQHRVLELKELFGHSKKNQIPNTCILLDANAVRKADYQIDLDGTLLWDILEQDDVDRIPEITAVPTDIEQLIKNNHFSDCSDKKKQLSGPHFTVWSGKIVDYILMAKSWNLPIKNWFIVPSAASDHCPKVMDVSIKKPASKKPIKKTKAQLAKEKQAKIKAQKQKKAAAIKAKKQKAQKIGKRPIKKQKSSQKR